MPCDSPRIELGIGRRGELVAYIEIVVRCGSPVAPQRVEGAMTCNAAQPLPQTAAPLELGQSLVRVEEHLLANVFGSLGIADHMERKRGDGGAIRNHQDLECFISLAESNLVERSLLRGRIDARAL